MPNRHQEDKISLPAKIHLKTPPSGVGRHPFPASGHRLRLGLCLVGPAVRWSVPGFGWSVWSSLWALFVGMMKRRIFCAFVLRLSSVLALFRVWVPAIQESPKLWKWLVLSPITTFSVRTGMWVPPSPTPPPAMKGMHVPWKQQTSSRPPEKKQQRQKILRSIRPKTQPKRRGEPHRSWNGGTRAPPQKRHPHRGRRQRQKRSSPEKTPPERIDYSPAKWCRDGNHPGQPAPP